MDPNQLMAMMQALRGQGAQLPPGLLGPPGGAPAAPATGAPPSGYMRPAAPLTQPQAPSGGLLSDNPMPAAAPGAPAGFPMPAPPASSMMPMDRLRAMGSLGGMPFGSRINTALAPTPSWLTVGNDPLAQIKLALGIGMGPMKGQPPATPAAAAPKVPATVEDAVKQLVEGGNSRNQGSAGDNAGHPAAFGGGGGGNTNPGYGAGGM